MSVNAVEAGNSTVFVFDWRTLAPTICMFTVMAMLADVVPLTVALMPVMTALSGMVASEVLKPVRLAYRDVNVPIAA
jgi:hypothetical protein